MNCYINIIIRVIVVVYEWSHLVDLVSPESLRMFVWRRDMVRRYNKRIYTLRLFIVVSLWALLIIMVVYRSLQVFMKNGKRIDRFTHQLIIIKQSWLL